jgi:hypothetical protein
MPAKPLALAFLQLELLGSTTGRELLSCIERVPNVATEVNHHQRPKETRQHATRTGGNTGDTPHLLLKRAGAIYRKET